jgi:hypothetical protein
VTNIICTCQSDEATIRQAGERFRAAAPHIECARTEAARLYIQCIMNMMGSGMPPSAMDDWAPAMIVQHKLITKILDEALASAAEERKLK